MKRLLTFLAVLVLGITLVVACEHGDTKTVWVLHGTNYYPRNVDSCIAPIIQALNSNGIPTLTSCCGHGTNGYILLKDRLLIVTPKTSEKEAKALYRRDWESFARYMEKVTKKITGR